MHLVGFTTENYSEYLRNTVGKCGLDSLRGLNFQGLLSIDSVGELINGPSFVSQSLYSYR
jgi:hypothetical protein